MKECEPAKHVFDSTTGVCHICKYKHPWFPLTKQDRVYINQVLDRLWGTNFSKTLPPS